MPQEDESVLIESYRVKLGLQPWEEWADRMAKAVELLGIKSTGRRSGRTTFGILRAIAMCEQREATVLAISAEPLANRKECVQIAKNAIAALGLSIRVTEDYPGCSRGDLSVLYTDHHIHIKRSAS